MNQITQLSSQSRLLLAHDWLTGMRGGERVLETICQRFPDAPIFSLIHNPAKISAAIRRHPINSSWLQRIPGIQRHYRYWLPFFPTAMASLQLPPADLLISISHCVAKGAQAPEGARHLCYCLTPMRYAWLFQEEYFGNNPIKKALLKPLLAHLRRWDQESSAQVDRFVAISRHVQARISTYYGRESDLVYPPVDTAYWTPAPTQPATTGFGAELGVYDLVVSALVPYKRVDLAVQAYSRSGARLVIVGVGPEWRRLRALAGPNIYFTGWLANSDIRDLYRRARALIFPGEEDFGIVPLEAQACGCPVVALGRGGALETVVKDVSGVFFQEQSPEALLDALAAGARRQWDPLAIRAQAERFAPEHFWSSFEKSLAQCLA